MSYRAEITNDKTGLKKVIPVIEDQPDGICELCGKVDDVRPYGPGGKQICFDCGMKDEERTAHNMRIQLYGDPGELK